MATRKEVNGARWRALEDAASLINANIRGGPTQFSYLSNQYASELDKELYRYELEKLWWSIENRAQKAKATFLELES